MPYRQFRRPGNHQAAVHRAAHVRPMRPYRSPAAQPMPVLPAHDADTFYDCPDGGMVPVRRTEVTHEQETAVSGQPPQTFELEEALQKGTLFPALFSPIDKNAFRRW